MNNRFLTTRRRHSRRTGFSLAEVLIALAIFAIGFTAVASIFPVAIVLQKHAIQDAVVEIGADNAKSLLRGRNLRHNDTSNPLLSLHPSILPEDKKVHALTRPIIEDWSRGDRSYPKSVREHGDREVYWEMVVRRTDEASTTANDWQVFVFVMAQEPGIDYLMIGPNPYVGYEDDPSSDTEVIWATHPDTPGDTWAGFVDALRTRNHPNVAGVLISGVSGNRFLFDNRRWPSETPAGEPDQVYPGDSVLDSNGTVYEVIDADSEGIEVDGFIMSSPTPPNRIWYGVPAKAGKPNPVRRILVLNNVVSPT